MKFDQLSYFLEVAKTQHVGKAAKALAISPSAISHSIKKLEEEFGRELFSKNGKQIALTSHGQLLMDRATRLLQQAECLKEEIQADHVELQGNFRIAATHFLCARYFAPAWADLFKENGSLTGEILSLRSAQVVQGVAAREYDLGLCFNPNPHPDLETKTLREGRLLVGVKKDHPLAKSSTKRWIEKIASFPAFLPKAFQGIEVCETHPVFKKYGIVPNVCCLVDSYETSVSMVLHTEGWGFFPEIIGEAFPELKFLPPPSPWEAPFSIEAVWSKHRYLPRAMKRFIEQLETSF